MSTERTRLRALLLEYRAAAKEAKANGRLNDERLLVLAMLDVRKRIDQ